MLKFTLLMMNVKFLKQPNTKLILKLTMKEDIV